MHIDCTNARVNWESAHVFVNATPDGKVYYSASTKKGHTGVEGTPAENYQGILVHDHELTFYNYGSDHQECLAHVLRYLKDSMQNEANHLLFLHNFKVPATNNEAERLLRGYKRKQAQAVSFRSFESIENLCRCMSMLIGMRKNPETNIFRELSNMFA